MKSDQKSNCLDRADHRIILDDFAHSKSFKYLIDPNHSQGF